MKWRLDMGQIECVDEEMAAILRTKTPAQKLAMAFDANETARMLIAAGIRSRNPDWTEAQIKAEVARRMTRIDSHVPLRRTRSGSPASPDPLS